MTKKKDTEDFDGQKVMTALADSLITGNASSKSVIRSRADLINWGMNTYQGERNVWQSLGYVLNPTFEYYNQLYERGDIATTVVNAMPDECWRLAPKVLEIKEDLKDTKFEKRWIELNVQYSILSKLHKVDRISGIGQFGALWLGFDDGLPPIAPLMDLGKPHNLTFLRPFKEDYIDILSSETDPQSPRFSLPETYRFEITTPIAGGDLTTGTIEVHHSRVIHVAEDTVDNDIYGTPRLKNVLNRLTSLELLAGGSAEMFWRGAFPGMVFSVDPSVQQDNSNLEDAKAKISDFVHNLQRYIRLKGIDVKSLPPQVADPSEHFNIQISLIAAGKSFPKRILIGSERGELASSQDESVWAKKLEARRINHIEPSMLRPTLDKLIEAGSLPKPAKGYEIEWSDMREFSPKTKAETESLRSTALATYVRYPEAQTVMPPEIFLREIMGFDSTKVRIIAKLIKKMTDEEKVEREEGGDDNFDPEELKSIISKIKGGSEEGPDKKSVEEVE